MKRLYKQLISIVLIAALCTVAPVRPTSAFTIGEEREVGEKLLYTIRSNFRSSTILMSQYQQSRSEVLKAVASVFRLSFFCNNNEFNALPYLQA
jgi:hypothetical protein